MSLGLSLRRKIRAQVTHVFNDVARHEHPVLRRADALFAQDSIAWRVHGDVVSMLAGGISSLLLQMLHPSVLAGVWDHSDFRADMHGRLRRTAKFISITTYDSAPAALALIDRINAVHARIDGVLPNGRPYAATDPRLLAWVHVTETLSFLDGWRRYGQPGMSPADQDRYFAEMACVAERLGADPIPSSRAEAEALVQAMRPELLADGRTREVRDLVLKQDLGSPLTARAARAVMRAGVGLLPDWARALHGLPPVPGDRLMHGQTLAMARTIRWAFSDSPNVQVWPEEITRFPGDG